MNRIKAIVTFAIAIAFVFVSCSKDDVQKTESTFKPLPVKEFSEGNFVNALTGKIITSSNVRQQKPIKRHEGWIFVWDESAGDYVRTEYTYMRWLYTPSSSEPLDCYLPMRNCLPTVEISAGIVNCEEPEGSTLDISQECASYVYTEYGRYMNDAVDNDKVKENYFNDNPSSTTGYSLHHFLNFNDDVQAMINSEEITFKRFSGNICVVFTDATDSDDCPEHFTNPDYDPQSNENTISL